MNTQVDTDVLLVGCGDLGTRIGRRLAERGYRVAAMRRRVELVPAPITGIAVDLTAHDPIPDIQAKYVVVALTADQPDEVGYRRVYVDGMRRALGAVTRRDDLPMRAVLISSTGVLGDGDGLVDESTPPQPTRATSKVLLQAEAVFHEMVPSGVVARMSGLYGARSPRLIQQVLVGDNPDPGRWGNRVHRDDAARAVVHLLCDVADLEPTYHVTDDEPATNADVRAFIAPRLGVAWPPSDSVATPYGKRLTNARLRSAGFTFTYPTYREGYEELLTSDMRDEVRK